MLPGTCEGYEPLDTQPAQSPFDTANILSLMTFAWMNPLMKLGSKMFITESKLPQIPQNIKVGAASNTFKKHWNNQAASNKDPSLLMALFKSFGGRYAFSGFFNFCNVIFSFVQPQLLRLLIKFVNDYQSGKPGVTINKGFLISLAMFCVSIAETSCLHQYYQLVFEVSINMKSALTTAIYDKSLLISLKERENKSTGDIVNLMSADTQQLHDFSQYAQTFWSGPLAIVLCLVSLHGIMGNSMWAGLGVMIVMVPVNSFITKYQKKYQTIQMQTKDKRVRLTNELLTVIKSLKLYGWEVPFVNRLQHVRNEEELENLKFIGIFMSIFFFLFTVTPFIVSCSTFMFYVYIYDTPLTPDKIFPALSLFNLLNAPMIFFPITITGLVEASVSLKRLTEFLTLGELQPDAIIRLDKANNVGEESVVLENATLLWSKDTSHQIALQNVNFKAFKGELSCIVGKVGSGKSAFLQAILGDLHRLQGTVKVKGQVAYVSQVPWIKNDTVKENILFGSKFDTDFYQKTITACALQEDFAIMPDGDETQVGEKGISLSGGQKARISLARAVYARADIYLLDDPLSAVDEHVGAHIIKNVLSGSGLLVSKTLILATNAMSVLSHADSISMIADRTITETGTYKEAMAAQKDIYRLLKEFGNVFSSNNRDDGDENTLSMQNEFEVQAFRLDETLQSNRCNSVNTLRRASTASFTPVKIQDDEEEEDKYVTKQKKEQAAQGKVSRSVYWEYAKSCNPYALAAYFFFLVAENAFAVSSSVWLKHWSEQNLKSDANLNVAKYLSFYFIFCVSSALSSMTYSLILWTGCAIYAAKRLHDNMLRSVVAAPMSFFETTPLGRIINRFSNDIFKIDTRVHRVISEFFYYSVNVSFTLIIIAYNTPLFLLLIIPLGALYALYQEYYLKTSRELKRLDSVTKSPLYAHFQETLGGVSTIRAYQQNGRFRFLNESALDLNLRAYFPSLVANRWLGVRVEFLGSVVILSASGLSIATLSAGHVTAGTIGLAMSYALQITQGLNWIVRMSVEAETNIISVERVMEYSNLPSEAPSIVNGHRPPTKWPSKGILEFNDYSTRYRPELGLVLKNITFSVQSREKIGIVGRTGAGKSSLTLALFRIIEAAKGNVNIDGIDISSIGLADLRHNLSIIPQDSQAFEGTLRSNLDPNKVHTDIELWRALELSHLKHHVLTMEGGLEAQVSENGSNLSVGQRQLLCIARALLTPSAVLVLDEATAAVDVQTDKLIQETIRAEFRDRTILTIAHRLNTIMDSDKIVVLDQGSIIEFDAPKTLLEDTSSMFYALCEKGGVLDKAQHSD